MGYLFPIVATGLLLFGTPLPLCAATIDCAPLKPGTQVDSAVQDTVKAQINLLLRSLGWVAVENGYRQVAADTLVRYPNADKLLLWREYIYVSCTLLAASSHWSDDDKWDRWMRLMNRWSDAPPADPPLTPMAPSSSRPPSLASEMAKPLVIGGIGLGTSIEQLKTRKDIALSPDSEGHLQGEETFTFTYGEQPGARQLDGNVVFGLRNGVVASITVTHTLGGANCADSLVTPTILNSQIHDWGAPLNRIVSVAADGAGSETASYTFRRDDTDMVLVLQTSTDTSGAALCRVSMNYQNRSSRLTD